MNIPDSHNSTFHELISYPLRTMGPHASEAWTTDPKHLLFSMARYKFCAKMLDGAKHILEVGCGDGFNHPILLQSVKRITAIDIVPEVFEIGWKQQTADVNERVTFRCHNIIKSPLDMEFDAAVSLDILEHIPREQEDRFVGNIARSLSGYAACIIGTPNVTAAQYAISPGSVKEHINLKDWKNLKELMSRYFHSVFIFSMNDEVVHTGFYPMAHYIFALAVSPKQKGE